MLLPHRELSWDTYKDPQTVMNTISSMTEQTLQPWKSESSRLFWGTVEEDSFQLSPRLETFSQGYSTTIRIEGKVIPASQGSHISIKMELQSFARGFMRVWFGFVAFFFCIFLLILLHDPGSGFRGVITALVMILGGQALIRILFKRQADKAEAVLREIFPS